MDMINTEDEENVFVVDETRNEEKVDVTTGNDASRDVYGYEDISDTDRKDTTDALQHPTNSITGSSSSRNDLMMSQLSENSVKNASSRRRINVIATSTGPSGSQPPPPKQQQQRHHRPPNSTTSYSNASNAAIIHFRPTQRVVLYSPPRQRQKWGDTQVLPRVNWFDLFFDLFYVGATYNVSSILYSSPNVRGLLYASGTFLPVMNIWMDRTSYEGRYVMDDDIVHRLCVIIAFTIVGVTIANIRSVDVLSDASHEPSMFFFALMLVVERFFASLLHVENYFCGVGQPKQLKSAAIRDCIFPNFSLPFFTAAMIIAAYKYYYGNDDPIHRRRFTADTTTSYNATGSETTDLPIALCLIGSIVKLLSYSLMIIFCLPKDGRHKEIAVPLNVDFLIHRYGEWMMLMLGESIFSLLIVDVQDKGLDFYLVFFFSLLTVILLQLLHFQSQPHDADSHAVRRNKNRGMLWNLLQSVYSLSLVIMGASYTFFLQYADESGVHRRTLANSSSTNYDSDRIGSAHLYSGALAVVFLSLTIMTILHKNYDEIQEQCFMKTEKKYAAALAAIIQIGVVVVAATISQWTLKPKFITLTGLLCVIADLSSRKIESMNARKRDVAHEATAPPGNKHNESEEEASWPNVTHAAANTETP